MTMKEADGNKNVTIKSERLNDEIYYKVRIASMIFYKWYTIKVYSVYWGFI
jgi:hypothetical protein